METTWTSNNSNKMKQERDWLLSLLIETKQASINIKWKQNGTSIKTKSKEKHGLII